MTKGLIQEDITVNTHALKTGAPQYIRQITGMKGEIDSNTINRGAVTPHLTSIYRSSRQKNSKEI